MGCGSYATATARNQLRLSDEILNTINSMVLVANGKGQIIHVNPSASKILGYPSAELLGYGWWLKTILDNAAQRESAERIASCARGEIRPVPEHGKSVCSTKTETRTGFYGRTPRDRTTFSSASARR